MRSGRVLLAVSGAGDVDWSGVSDYQREMKRVNGTVYLDLPAHGERTFEVSLPRRMAGAAEDAAKLAGLGYAEARAADTRLLVALRGARRAV